MTLPIGEDESTKKSYLIIPIKSISRVEAAAKMVKVKKSLGKVGLRVIDVKFKPLDRRKVTRRTHKR